MVDNLLLAGVHLFADLSKRDIEAISRTMQRRRYGRGRVVFMKGDPATSLYIVEDGRVKLVAATEHGEELIIGLLGPGDSFGEIALLDRAIRWVDAIAQERSTLLVLHRDDFAPLVRSRPEVAERLVSIMDRYILRLTELAVDGAFMDVQGRLAKLLLSLAGAEERVGEDGLVIGPEVTQTDLAGMIGATRRSVNKWLSYFHRAGLIRSEKGYITLLRPELLRKHVS